MVGGLGKSMHDLALSPLPQFWLCDRQTFLSSLMLDYTAKLIIQIMISLVAILGKITVSMG